MTDRFAVGESCLLVDRQGRRFLLSLDPERTCGATNECGLAGPDSADEMHGGAGRQDGREATAEPFGLRRRRAHDGQELGAPRRVRAAQWLGLPVVGHIPMIVTGFKVSWY